MQFHEFLDFGCPGYAVRSVP